MSYIADVTEGPGATHYRQTEYAQALREQSTEEDADTDAIVRAARSAGATGATVLNQARGEGYVPQKPFFGLDLGPDVFRHDALVERCGCDGSR